jgi:hypothetical protein
MLALLAGCPGDEPREDGSTETGIISAGNPGTSSGDDTTGSDTTVVDDSGSGTTAAACEDTCDGECIAGSCCELEKACDDVCCGEAEVCSFQECVVPGAECVDASECPDDNYCEYSLGEPGKGGGMGMCQGGASPATGKCLPEPPECPPGVEPSAR